MEKQHYSFECKKDENRLIVINNEELTEYDGAEELYESETRKAWKNVRIRNLLINITKNLIKNEQYEKIHFSQEELVKTFKFKEYDFKYIVGDIFKITGQDYCLIAERADFIKKIIASHFAVSRYLPSAEAKFLRIYGRYYDSISKQYFSHTSYDKYHEMYEDIKDVLPVLHWGYLPIYERYLLYNRGIDPERDVLKFYDHIDCLNALLNEVKGKPLELENKSDSSLNVDIAFMIYSRKRNMLEDNIIRRTVDGWYFKFMTMEGRSQKDGSGTFTDYLERENLFYPYEGVTYALKNLWDAVDDGEIEYNEYISRIREISNWINITDQVLDKQPQWLQYKNGDIYYLNEQSSLEAGKKTLYIEMKFNVYTRRWGHEDCYKIIRTDTGWYCKFSAINGDCNRNGRGALQQNLNHDCVFYPREGIEYAMLKLWDEANRGIIDLEILSERLQQVAEWISISEKSIYEQPEWVYYY